MFIHHTIVAEKKKNNAITKKIAKWNSNIAKKHLPMPANTIEGKKNGRVSRMP